MITTAVIMAAGMGTRFGERTETMPKGFIPFKGKSMVERSIDNLISSGIKKIIVGTGYHREWYERLAIKYSEIITVFSPLFAETNSMETLSRCSDAIGGDDFLLLESDIVYAKKALALLLEAPKEDIMLVTPVTKFQDQYYIGTDSNSYLKKCSTEREAIIKETGKEPVGELVGIHKISNKFYRDMLEIYEYTKSLYRYGKHLPNPEKTGYEFFLEDVATWQPFAANFVGEDGSMLTLPSGGISKARDLFVLIENGLQWYEIDDVEDLKFAESHILID